MPKSLAQAQQLLEQAHALSKAVPGVGLPELPAVNINKKAQEQAASVEALFGALTANAGPRRDRWKTYPGTGLTPAIIRSIQQQADIGYVDRWQELLSQAEKRDSRWKALHRGRVVAVAGRPCSIRPKDGSPEAKAMAALVEECLDGMSGWKSGLKQLLNANVAAFGAVEPIYRWRKIRIPWKETSGKATTITAEVKAVEEWRRVQGKHFSFATDNTSDTPLPKHGKVVQIEGQTPLLNASSGYIYLPRPKFVFHVSGDEGTIQERGWGRPAIWLHAFKQKGVASWGEFVNRFGVPNVRGAVPYNIWTDKVRSAIYFKILELYGEGIHALTPDDLKIIVDKAVEGGTSRDPIAAFIGWLDTALTILVQGEHLTTEIGDVGSYNAASEQAQEKRSILEDDADSLAETLRDQFFWSLVWLNAQLLAEQLNVPPWVLIQKRPTIIFRLDARTSRKERLEEMDIYVNKLKGRLTERQVQDEGGFDPPGPDESVMEGAPQTLPAASKDAAPGKPDAGGDAPAATGGGPS